jgi:lipoprotein-anchoring transpeptidase ErfK/SrfK
LTVANSRHRSERAGITVRSLHVSTHAHLACLGTLMVVAATSTALAHAASTNGVTAVKPSQALATLLSSHVVRARPTASSARIGVVAESRPITDVRTVLPVLARRTNASGFHWLRVRLPGRPNGSTGWIVQKATLSSSTRWRIVVETSTRSVSIFKDGRRARRFFAVVGKPSTPTPQGEFFVEESIRLSSRMVGAPFALALSARSDVIQEFDGGPGQIALHGLENVGGVLGTAQSHGCVRLDTAAMTWLVARIAPGTPVTITR